MTLPPLPTALPLACAETGFDPAQVTDKDSKDVIADIFDAPPDHDLGALPKAHR